MSLLDLSLSRQLDELKAAADHPQRRGLAFQDFVVRLFEAHGFRVTPNAGAAHPRDADLVAARSGSTYLVEVKWHNQPAELEDIDSLLIRLDETAPTVIGVLVSMSGVRPSVIDRVEAKRQRPVLLVGPEEVEVLSAGGDLARVLKRKLDHLLTAGRALTWPASSDPPDTQRRALKRVPQSISPTGRDGSGLPAAAPSLISASRLASMTSIGRPRAEPG